MSPTKKALITGASEGIGRVFANRLAQDGYSITGVARNETRLKEMTATLPGSGHHHIVADLASKAGVEKVKTAIETGGFDLLINNAGFGAFGAFHETSIETLNQMLQVNCQTLATLSHAFLNHAKSGDALLYIASTASFHAIPKNGFYAATKAFVLSLSESLWYEQRPRGVYVVALCPGYTLTEFSRRAGKEDVAAYRKFAQTPEQVVEVGLRALKARKTPSVISGFQNGAMTQLQRLLPRKTLAGIAGKTFEKYLSLSGDGGLNKA